MSNHVTLFYQQLANYVQMHSTQMNPTKSLTILVTNLLFSQLQLCQSYSCDFQQASCARACALCQFRMI